MVILPILFIGNLICNKINCLMLTELERSPFYCLFDLYLKVCGKGFYHFWVIEFQDNAFFLCGNEVFNQLDLQFDISN